MPTIRWYPRPCRVVQNVIQSFGSRQDLLNPAKKPSKGLEKATIAAKAELENMAEVSKSRTDQMTRHGRSIDESGLVRPLFSWSALLVLGLSFLPPSVRWFGSRFLPSLSLLAWGKKGRS